MIDIYCKNGKCPICDSEVVKTVKLNINIEHRFTCLNGCYVYAQRCGTKTFILFDRTFYQTAQKAGIRPSDLRFKNNNWEIEQNAREKIENKIEYWKENDRYLSEILSKSQG